MSFRFPLLVLGGLVGAAVVLLTVLAGLAPTSPTSPVRTPTNVAPPAGVPTNRSGQAPLADLGERPISLGSSGQARELLKIMNQQPGKAQYGIFYSTTEDVITIVADFNAATLRRERAYFDGRRSKEIWDGYPQERLQAAADGKSLNDTPVGTRPGTYTTTP